MSTHTNVWETEEFKQLKAHVKFIETLHLRDLLKDEVRCKSMCRCVGKKENNRVIFDFSRQCVTSETMDLLFRLAQVCQLKQKVHAMFRGQRINATEGRAVLHMALRAGRQDAFSFDGQNIVPEVHGVLDKIQSFSERVRCGKWVGATGKQLTSVVSVGIGGSYLGPEFLAEALKTDAKAREAARGRQLRFLANVDPVGVMRALDGLDPETTLIVVCSKTFTTAETMLNARTVRSWLQKGMKNCNSVCEKHMVACSANVSDAQAFGILPENVFFFWEWVGGRFSVSSSIGILPISLQYGFGVARDFLDGAHEIDNNFINADFESNLPVIMGLLSVWNSTFLNFSSKAILPYSEALLRFPAHVQQVDMESNGKRVTLEGTIIPFATGEINFGEPGTNGQHSFYQLLHQGRVIPCEFIGSCNSQQEIDRTSNIDGGEYVTNHDELMSNFFAQPDALAYGKTVKELESDGIPKNLWPHKEFSGNRPSMSLLFTRFDAYSLGQLVALYEHRTVVQGFIWGLNSFDQWGVELGKVLAKKVRASLSNVQEKQKVFTDKLEFNFSTARLMKHYIDAKDFLE